MLAWRFNSSMLSTSHTREAKTWTQLRRIEERKNAWKTNSTCQESVVRGIKWGKTRKDAALQNETFDALKTTEEKSRRYSKKIQQNTWNTDSWSARKSWVQAKDFSKRRHYENPPGNSGRENQPKIMESLQIWNIHLSLNQSGTNSTSIEQIGKQLHHTIMLPQTATDVQCIGNHGQETAMIIMMNSKPKQKKTIPRSN